jgi:hypothetical protein
MLRSILVERTAEQKEDRDEDGYPKNAGRGASEAEAHAASLRGVERPVIPVAAAHPARPEAAGTAFIAENGGGTGLRLRRPGIIPPSRISILTLYCV